MVLLVPNARPEGARANASGDDHFGIDFVNAQAGNFSNQSQRYAEASQAGAGWDRWVIYWSSVDKLCNGSYDWSTTDPVVSADATQGLSVDAVLLSTPSCDATSTAAPRPLTGVPLGGLTNLAAGAQSVPRNLNTPVFSDGTDIYLPGKTINSDNPWAFFVYTAVSRYHGQIHNWEIWNEPDYSAFWSGSVSDYARLLKVAYLAAHAADNSARILVGGMMYWEWANQSGDQAWLKAFLSAVTVDPQAPANGYFFDVIPWHWYSRSSDNYVHTASATSVLASYGITGKEIWVNETNAPACDDSAGGTTFPCATSSPGYANDTEQASYMLQALAYGFAGGANKVFEFQLQDDGNAQALGMFRNDGSTRPEYLAYKVGEKNLTGFQIAKRQVGDGWEAVTFGVPGTGSHRATVIWNDTGQSVNALVAGAGVTPTSVTLIQQDGTTQNVTPGAAYSITLPPATDNRNWDNNPNEFIIGGPTLVLVENLPTDVKPPISHVTSATYQTSNGTFLLNWSGSDPGGWGVADYTIQYRDLTVGGAWTAWLTNTTNTSGTFSPKAGDSYQFRSLARDWAANVEGKCPGQSDSTVSAKASTAGPTPFTIYLPIIANGGSLGC